jgi:hypothetical protein
MQPSDLDETDIQIELELHLLAPRHFFKNRAEGRLSLIASSFLTPTT